MNKRHWIVRWFTGATVLMLTPLSLSAATYEVGPSMPYTTIGQVPWESLSAGDTVLIHWRSQPYQEKWVICRQGTAAAPITVRGIPGPNGQLPVIDGNGATTRAQLNFWNQNRAVIKIGGASAPPDTTPAHIILEGLDVRSARPPFTYHTQTGAAGSYIANAAAIYVEKGTNIIIRGCELHDCGNGLFIAADTRRALIQGNLIHDNGNEGSAFEHNSYTAALDITFQFNRYGSLRPNCLGNALKDRSAGLVVRYNWLEGGNRQLDLVDAEDSVELQQSPLYQTTHVYGNVLVEPDNEGNSQIVHYGGDSGNTPAYRKGSLHFYHNTVVSTRTGNTTLFRLSTNDEFCDARNNVVLVTAAGNRLALLDGAGRLTITRNWFKPGYVSSHSGLTGLITNDGSNLTGTDPGFLALVEQEFRLNTNSACINVGTNLHAAVLPDHAPTWHYRKHQLSGPRTNHLAPDLGAFEFSPYAAWQRTFFGTDMTNAGIASEWADPDGDRVFNLFEYAHLTDPNVASPAGLPEPLVISNEPTRHLAIQFARRLPPSELLYTIEMSDDLVQWQAGAWYSDAAMAASNALMTEVTNGALTTVRVNASMDANPHQYLRVRIQPLWQ